MTEEQFLSGVEKIRAGNKDGLQEIYIAYSSYIYMIVYEILRNREDAEDVTSEFFIRLYRVAEMYSPGSGHKGWLATIARNLALDHIRKYSRETAVEEVEEEVTTFTGSPEKEVVGQLSVQQALDTLPESERQIIAMKILGDMKFREIADVLQIPLGTVTWKYQNALKSLRRCGFE